MVADPIRPPQAFAGTRDSLTMAVVTTINADASVDTRSTVGRGGKAGVLVPSWYVPTPGDRVLVGDIDGNDQRPVVVQVVYPATGLVTAPNARFGGLAVGGAGVFNVFNVKDQAFGAKGDGITDDTAAIQAAIVAAALVGGTVFLPPGVYLTTATLTWANKVRMIGAGTEASVIHYTGTSRAITFGSGTLTADDPWAGMSLADFRVNGSSAAAGGIQVRGATRWNFERIRVSGFTTGYGILLNGASFIGQVDGGRIDSCGIGVSAKKQAGDGGDGRGQAFNAIELCGQLEIQSCGYGVQLGDPATTETAPVVGMGANIHDITVEGSTSGGIWNVGANAVSVRNNYYEANAGFDYRQGSTGGNTSTPVSCSIGGNFFYVANNTCIDLIAGLHTRIEPNYFLADTAPGRTAVTVAAACTSTRIDSPFVNTLATDVANASGSTVYWTMQAGGPRLDIGVFNTLSDLNTRLGDFGQTSIGRVGPGNEAGILMGSAADARVYRVAAAKPGTDGDFAINAAGKGLQVKGGANAKIGTATANGATAVVVATTAVTANSLIFLTIQTPGGTPGAPFVSAVTPGTSFAFKSVAGDTSTVGWMIVEKL